MPRRKNYDSLFGNNDMSVKNLKNIPASVRQRLFNRSEKDRRPFIEILQYYAGFG